MRDQRFSALAGRQRDVVARWQLIRAGIDAQRADRWSASAQRVHEGVHLVGWSRPTERQLQWAAVLTAPGTVLSHASAAALWGIRSQRGSVQTVVRVGNRGRFAADGLLISYSLTLRGWITERDGLPVTSVERTLIDLWPHLPETEATRALREALRLRLTTTPAMQTALRAHRGRRGVARLGVVAAALDGLALHRCLSDPEALAVALIAQAGLPAPEVNRRVCGHRADLCWPEHRVIVELDGPQYHVLRDVDVAIQRAWEAAGYTVLRLPTDVVYTDPARLLALVPNSDRRTSGIPR